jgi:hypothetical protein
MLNGQCLHASYVSTAHVSDQHQNKYKYAGRCNLPIRIQISPIENSEFSPFWTYCMGQAIPNEKKKLFIDRS